MTKTFTQRLFLLLLTALLAIVAILAMGMGAVQIAPMHVLRLLSPIGLHDSPIYHDQQFLVLWEIRLPRIALAVLTGAALGVSGAVMQGLLRNPLADPGLLGVSSGAALAAASVIVLGQPLMSWLDPACRPYGLMIGAFIGGLLVSTLVYVLTVRQGNASLSTMLLVGIAINALASAAIGLLTYLANDMQMRTLVFWTLGSLSGATWGNVTSVAIVLLITVFMLFRLADVLNVLALGEKAARALGVNLGASKRRCILAVSLAVSSVVAMTGMIGFVGLIAPQIVRLVFGSNHRIVLPASMLIGALLVLLADTATRLAVPPTELPIGILTALLGAPVFLSLLLKKQ